MASFVIAAASRFPASAPGPLRLSDARVRSPARWLSAATISSSVGAARAGNARTGSSALAASAIKASLAS